MRSNVMSWVYNYLKNNLSVQKLHDDLDYWIMIGIDDDIINCPDHRPEYQPLVRKVKKRKPEHQTKLVLWLLKQQLKRSFLFRSMFWWLVWIRFKGIVKS